MKLEDLMKKLGWVKERVGADVKVVIVHDDEEYEGVKINLLLVDDEASETGASVEVRLVIE